MGSLSGTFEDVMIRIPTGRRFILFDRKLTPEEHEKVWHEQIINAQNAYLRAVRDAPPWTITEQIEVKPDDPRYATAPIGEDWISL